MNLFAGFSILDVLFELLDWVVSFFGPSWSSGRISPGKRRAWAAREKGELERTRRSRH